MSTVSHAHDHSHDKPIDLTCLRVETEEAVRRRIADTMSAITSLHASGQALAATTSCPQTPELAQVFLTREIDASIRRASESDAVARAAQERERMLVARCAEMSRQLDADRHRCEATNRLERQRAAMQRQEDEEAVAKADQDFAVATAEWQSTKDAMKAARRRSDPGRALQPRIDRLCEGCVTAAQAAALKARHRADLAMICRVGDCPIPWKRERVIAGQRMAPRGCAVEVVQMPAPYSRMVGCLGRLSQVTWSACDAVERAALIFDAQRVPCVKRGGRVKHVGHGVLSKSLAGEEPAQTWTPETAMRAAVHFLIGQGVEPARHDAVVFIHSQWPGPDSTATKREESVHILWCRRRDDGAYHVNPHACVSALISRTRHDNHAGIDPERIGVSVSDTWPVRAGMEHARQRSLSAWYVNPMTGAKIDEVKILGEVVAQRLAAEGRPDDGEIAGVWSMKPFYRTADETRLILRHLTQGD
jgi:hypothetical protein